MPIYPSNNYNNLMAKSQLATNNVAEFRERTIYDVVNNTTGETTRNYPSSTLYDFADDIVLGEGYVIANIMVLPNIVSALTMTPSQQNYFVKGKENKIMHLIRLSRKMAFEIRKLSSEGTYAANATTQNLSNAPEPTLPSSQSIRSHLNQ